MRAAAFALALGVLSVPAAARHDGEGHAPLSRVWRDTRSGETHHGALLAVSTHKVVLQLAGEARVELPVEALAPPERALAQAVRERVEALNAQPLDLRGAAGDGEPWQCAPFRAFAPHVRVRWDERWLQVESDGMPHEPLAFRPMVGIRTWQEQVPLPQPYVGDNAWSVPLRPQFAPSPISGRTHLRRGAIAIAANGIPIFNALNNRGADAFAIGELDEFGGHCGRADDYHYHVAPLALAKVLGPDAPLGFALDGFALYGLFDPRAQRGEARACPLGAAAALDEFNGHSLDGADTERTYHYHASERYPYINGGLRGRVTLEDDAVAPQPRAQGVRPAQEPLRGAAITAFKSVGERAWSLTYALRGAEHRIDYHLDERGAAHFEFVDPSGAVRSESYTPRARNTREGERGARRDQAERASAGESDAFVLRSSAVDARGRLDRRFTCDGEGVSPPFEWSAPPPGTTGFALTLHHVPPEGGEHVYLVLWKLGPQLRALAAAQREHGEFGQNSVRRRAEYAPPCSQGPGEKLYTATLYALKAEPVLSSAPAPTRAELLEEIEDLTLASATLELRYSRESEPAQGSERQGRGARDNERNPRAAEEFRTQVPTHAHNTVLARPGATTMTISLQVFEPLEVFVSYGRAGAALSQRTRALKCQPGAVTSIELRDLTPDSEYRYRLHTRRELAEGELEASEERAFSTQRAPGKPFVFCVQADSHLDENMSAATYERTLANVLADRPDFLIDLGDTFMTDKYGPRFQESAAHYQAQRYYFGLACRSVPLLMALGNHDGEAGYAAGPGGIAEWSYRMRAERFPPPTIEAGGIYTGRTDYSAGRGANYFAFEWGDALFVVLDPFWPTQQRVRGASAKEGFTDESWARTLGREQYDWLVRTLRGSRAPLRFLFTHHLVGGRGREARGGVESAPHFEWGGRNADGSDGFAARRPGWPAPIHAVLVEHGVSAVFHGHDHLFVRSELDGVVYQCVPQPGNERSNTRSAAEYGYASGVVLPSPGHLRIRVSSQRATVEFVRSAPLASDARRSAPERNGEVVYSYDVSPRER